MRILVVDDEPAVLRTEVRALEGAGHSCRGAPTMSDARGFLTNESFDLAVLDVNLGRDSGLELARLIRSEYPDTNVIMVTGTADFTSVSDARLAGALDYLIKPVGPRDLTDAVERIGDLRQRKVKGSPRRRAESEPVIIPHRAKTQPVAVTPIRQKTAPVAVLQQREGEPVIDGLFRAMVEQGASDLHLSAGVPANIRVDGEMRPLDAGADPLSAEDVVQLIEPIVPGKNRVEFEKRHDSDFAYEVPGLARFRCNIFLDRKGMGAVFRRVPTKITTAEELGLSRGILDLCAL